VDRFAASEVTAITATPLTLTASASALINEGVSFATSPQITRRAA